MSGESAAEPAARVGEAAGLTTTTTAWSRGATTVMLSGVLHESRRRGLRIGPTWRCVGYDASSGRPAGPAGHHDGPADRPRSGRTAVKMLLVPDRRPTVRPPQRRLQPVLMHPSRAVPRIVACVIYGPVVNFLDTIARPMTRSREITDALVHDAFTTMPFDRRDDRCPSPRSSRAGC